MKKEVIQVKELWYVKNLILPPPKKKKKGIGTGMTENEIKFNLLLICKWYKRYVIYIYAHGICKSKTWQK